MEITKKLDFEKISCYLCSVYADKLIEFEKIKDAALYRVGVPGKQSEPYVFAVAVIFARKNNPQSQLQLLYYPIANETAIETSILLSKNIYLSETELCSKYVKFYVKQGAYYQEWRGFSKMVENIDDALARLNVCLLFSSDEILQREAFVPNKKLIPYHTDMVFGYCYKFLYKNREKTLVVNKNCEEYTLSQELRLLKSPKVFGLLSGKTYYFTGRRFIEKQGDILTKDEARSYFEDIVKQFPGVKFYGHLIPIYEVKKGECVPAWIVGYQDSKHVAVALKSGDIHYADLNFKIAPPDDVLFFPKSKI